METMLTINGVPGRYWKIKNPGVRAEDCHDCQKWVSESRPIAGWGSERVMRVTIRHDDECKNQHNSFAITAEIYRPGLSDIDGGGCLHDEIVKVFPELKSLIKWHLSSTDEPMHYLANTLYWLGFQGWCGDKSNDPPNLEHARKTAVWPDMPENFVCPPALRDATPGTEAVKEKKKLAAEIGVLLMARLPSLLKEFQDEIEGIGFEFTHKQEATT